MSIIIFGDLFTFPEGSAATNRVYTYAKGFIENGVQVHVICITNDYNIKPKGIEHGIYYYNPFNRAQRSKYFIVRSWQKVVKYYRTYRIIKKINKSDKIIAFNSWSNFLTTHLFGFLLSRLTSSKFIVECSEHPLRFYQNGIIKQTQGKFNFWIESAISDGVFCISHYLMDFYKSKGISDKKLFLVPSTVDPTRFNLFTENPVSYKYIGYFGSLTFKRDNIDILIKAFALFVKKHPDVHLVLGGLCTPAERKEIQDLVTGLALAGNVTLLDFMSREKIIEYIMHSEILVMVRSNNSQTQASFPSKLTEFLASSKPVISFNVGEISLYLEDGKNVFLVDHGDIASLADKLEFVYANPQLSSIVGQNGRRMTETVFNYKFQADRMLEFIRS